MFQKGGKVIRGAAYMRSLQCLALGAAAILVLAAPASAQNIQFTPELLTPEPFDEAFFGFAARAQLHVDWLAGYEDNYIFGAGYQRFLGDPNGLRYGLEVGLAGRFGYGEASLEAWGGVVARYDMTFFDTIKVGSALTIGLSVVTNTMPGHEREREAGRHGDATLLFYLGPEVSVSHVDNPNLEVFLRLHHRSGAWTTLGKMTGVMDATAVGIRYHF